MVYAGFVLESWLTREKSRELKKPVGKNMNDAICDFLIRIKNASMARQKRLTIPHSNFKEEVAKVLKKEGFVKTIEVAEVEGKKQLVLVISEEKQVPKIEIKIVSKPGQRIYLKNNELRRLRGIWTVILSTPAGVMTAKQAVKEGFGGEVICKIVKE